MMSSGARRLLRTTSISSHTPHQTHPTAKTPLLPLISDFAPSTRDRITPSPNPFLSFSTILCCFSSAYLIEPCSEAVLSGRKDLLSSLSLSLSFHPLERLLHMAMNPLGSNYRLTYHPSSIISTFNPEPSSELELWLGPAGTTGEPTSYSLSVLLRISPNNGLRLRKSILVESHQRSTHRRSGRC